MGPVPPEGFSLLDAASEPKVPRRGAAQEIDRGQELMPGLRLLVKEPQHAGRDHRGLGLLDAPAGHAAVDPFDDDSDPPGVGAPFPRCWLFLRSFFPESAGAWKMRL